MSNTPEDLIDLAQRTATKLMPYGYATQREDLAGEIVVGLVEYLSKPRSKASLETVAHRRGVDSLRRTLGRKGQKAESYGVQEFSRVPSTRAGQVEALDEIRAITGGLTRLRPTERLAYLLSTQHRPGEAARIYARERGVGLTAYFVALSRAKDRIGNVAKPVAYGPSGLPARSWI